MKCVVCYLLEDMSARYVFYGILHPHADAGQLTDAAMSSLRMENVIRLVHTPVSQKTFSVT